MISLEFTGSGADSLNFDIVIKVLLRLQNRAQQLNLP